MQTIDDFNGILNIGLDVLIAQDVHIGNCKYYVRIYWTSFAKIRHKQHKLDKDTNCMYEQIKWDSQVAKS